MKKLLFTTVCMCLYCVCSHAFMMKPLYVIAETTGNGIVYMTDDENYLAGEHENMITSEASVCSEYRKRFIGQVEEGGSYPTTSCDLYFHVKADAGYGLLGFTEEKHSDGVYEDKDFVLGTDGKRAISGSCINVDDPNQPWTEVDSEDTHVVGNLSLYNETPNKHYYAVFTEVPDFKIADGVDMGNVPESPTGTYTVRYSRHLNKGWNAVYLPCAFDVEQLKATIDSSEVYMIAAYVRSTNQLFFGTGMKQVPACAPMLIYSPKDYDYEYVGTDKAVSTKEEISTSIFEDGAPQCLVGTFANKTVEGKCYNLTYDGKEFAFTESNNKVSAFQYAIVFDDETAAPKSKSIKLCFMNDDTNGINTIEAAPRIANDGIYTLDGRRLNAEPTHGIFIKNGKKFVR